MKNRYYDSSYARFLTEDPYWNVNNMLYGGATSSVIRNVYYPAVVQSGNLYGYGLNSPLKFVDPKGESVGLIFAGVLLISGLLGLTSCGDSSLADKSIIYKTTSINSLPKNVQDSYNGYSSVNWKGNYPGQTPGTAAGRVWSNSFSTLPSYDIMGTPITYQEFDVNNKIDGKSRDTERFIVGSGGSVYYTKDHYKSFQKIK